MVLLNTFLEVLIVFYSSLLFYKLNRRTLCHINQSWEPLESKKFPHLWEDSGPRLWDLSISCIEDLMLQMHQLFCSQDIKKIRVKKNPTVRQQRLKSKNQLNSLSFVAPSSPSPLSQLSPLLSPHQWPPPLHDASLLRGFLCSLVSQVNICMGQRRGGGRKDHHFLKSSFGSSSSKSGLWK